LTLGNNLTLSFDIGTNAGATVTDTLASSARRWLGHGHDQHHRFRQQQSGFRALQPADCQQRGLTSETFVLGNSTVVVNGTTYGLSLIPDRRPNNSASPSREQRKLDPDGERRV